MEELVRRYFQGVTEKNASMIQSCFGETDVLRDVCAINSACRIVRADDVVERRMDFVRAHPDCIVHFEYGPECGHQSTWVFCALARNGHVDGNKLWSATNESSNARARTN
jgi:hypothetical protein